MIYKITVHQGYRWSDAQISGRTFSKRAVTEVSEHGINEEIKRAAEGDNPILVIEEVVLEDQPDAGKGAKGKGSKGGSSGKKNQKEDSAGDNLESPEA